MSEVTIKVIGNYSYQTSHCLGEGVYGKVYEGKDDQTKEHVAIKKIDLQTFTNDRYLENAIFSEIYLMKRFNHPNIVRFRDVLTSKNSLYIITEFCSGGDLRELIKRRRFREDEAFDVVRQILSGFTQLVQEKIIHRDLKPANILVKDGVYKIADFGFAKYVDNFGTQMLKSCVGSPIYMAPQILEKSPYTTKSDIWSIGVMFYEMLFGYPPWKARDEPQLLRALRMMPIHQLLRREAALSPRASDFLKRCLAYQEDDRANWNELFDMYLPKERMNTPIMPIMSPVSFEDSPMKAGENSGRGRYVTTLTAPLNSGSAPGPRSNGILPGFEKRQSLPSNPSLIQPPMKAPITTPTGPSHGIPIAPTYPVGNPQKRSNAPMSNGIIDTLRLMHEQCILKHFVCVQLFTSLPMLRQVLPDSYRQERLVFLLPISTRVISASCLNAYASQLKNIRALEDQLRKLEREHQSYEELEMEISKQLEKLGVARRVREDLAGVVFSKSELISEDKVSKMESTPYFIVETLFRLAIENCQILLAELQKRGLNWLMASKYGASLVQLLDELHQLCIVLQNRDKLLELSLVTWPDDAQTGEAISRVLHRVSTFLTNH